jgi:chemotaxis protein CheD
MNHFLLPGNDGREAERYGVHLMELLVNGLLQKGARRERLEAKLFGGGKTMEGLSDIGTLNAAFAEKFLRNEGITVNGGSLRGDRGRRIQFWPVNGRARQVFLTNDQVPVTVARPVVPAPAPGGDIDFF